MSQPEKSPYVCFAKGSSAPCLRIVCHNGEQLLLQYMHISLMSLSKDATLLCIYSGDNMMQIEGNNLAPLFLNLQNFQVSYIQVGKEEKSEITKVVGVKVES